MQSTKADAIDHRMFVKWLRKKIEMEGVRVTHQGVRAHSAEGSAGRITQAGLAARSAEGTAAKGMAIKGHEDLWVEIQANTFRNWVNETLKPVDIKVLMCLIGCSFLHLCSLDK